MKYKDYYAALGVPRDADADAIKKAYRKLARQHHPDVSSAAGAEARFKDAAEAYATLRDPDKRAAYNALGRRRGGEEFSPPPRWQREFGGDTFGASGLGDLDLSDLLDALGRGRGSRARSQSVPLRGRDYETAVQLTLEDAHRGTTVNIDVTHEDGTRTLAVTVPAGVTDGQRLRLRGKGGAGRHGGPAGDIYLHIALAPHALFRTDAHDLLFDLALAPWEAALGAEVEVPTLDGPVLLTVPPGTQSGRKLRLRGRGLATGTGGRADMYATARVDVPASLTPRERALFEELARESRFDPRAIVAKEAAHGQ